MSSNTGLLLDIEMAERLMEKVTQLHEQEARYSPKINTSKIEILDALGSSLRSLSSASSNLQIIDKFITCRALAASLTPNNHSLKITRVNHLGESLWFRMRVQRSLPDIDRLIECYTLALGLCRARNWTLEGALDMLATTRALRYDLTNEVHDIDLAIEYAHQAVVTLGDSYVGTRGSFVTKASLFRQLGTFYQTKFTRSGAAEDINKAVEHHAQAVFYLKDVEKSSSEYLWSLATAFQQRFQHLGESKDFEQVIECINLESNNPSAEHKSKHEVFHAFGVLYRNRFEWFGHLEDIKSAVGYLTQAFQLLTQAHPDMPRMLDSLASCLSLRFGYLHELADIDKAIEYATQAVALAPHNSSNMRERLSNLGTSYLARFRRLGGMQDLDKSVECHKQSILLTPDGHIDKARWLGSLGNAYRCRYHRLDEPLDLDKAIECQVRGVELMPEGHREKARSIGNLGNSYIDRFDRLAELSDINRAIECHTRAFELTSEGQPGKAMWLLCLGRAYGERFNRLGGIEDINKTIECQRQAVLLTPEDHIDRARSLGALGDSYGTRFQHLKDIVDINKSIECQTQASRLVPDGHAEESVFLRNLGLSLLHRYGNLGTLEDIYQAAHCFEKITNSPAGSPSARFEAAKLWVLSFRGIRHSPLLLAYSAAIRLIPEVVWLGATVNHRYDDVVSIGAIVVEAAATAISAGKHDLALEWLEEGRSIIWSQTQQLRSPMKDLFAISPTLAQKLEKVALSLDSAGARKPNLMSEAINESTFEDASHQHRTLAQQYDDLLNEARLLPGFGNFLRPRKAAEIMRAAYTGPVVMINVYSSRCDALALLPGSDKVAHIPLPDLSQGDVTSMRAHMEESLRSNDVRERRLYRAGEKDRDHFETILAALWHKIAKPVLEFLGYMELQPESQLPHITWCTTGDLSFLPIHAAGCYDKSQPNIFDLAISSYTPTLGALLTSSSRVPTTLSGILAVGQEATAGCTPLPGTRHELASVQRHAKGLVHTQLSGDQATVSAVLEAMETHDSVHLACHASQDVSNPTESGFHLHNGTLALAQIARKSFKNKRLAFLSACQTAAGDKKLPDEAVHLAAGMMAAGYPSVIATMWSIKDNDAPLIADQVYARLLKSDGLGSTRGAAEALHSAVGTLRAEVGEKEFARWVPYIHMGI